MDRFIRINTVYPLGLDALNNTPICKNGFVQNLKREESTSEIQR